MSTDFYSFEMDDEVEPECTGEQNDYHVEMTQMINKSFTFCVTPSPKWLLTINTSLISFPPNSLIKMQTILLLKTL